jgi:hypothetical protein
MHLAVLRRAGMVASVAKGRQRIYQRRLAEVCDLLAQAQTTTRALAAHQSKSS